LTCGGQPTARGRLYEMRQPSSRRERLDDCSRPRIVLGSDREQKHDVRGHDRPNRNAGQTRREPARSIGNASLTGDMPGEVLIDQHRPPSSAVVTNLALKDVFIRSLASDWDGLDLETIIRVEEHEVSVSESRHATRMEGLSFGQFVGCEFIEEGCAGDDPIGLDSLQVRQLRRRVHLCQRVEQPGVVRAPDFWLLEEAALRSRGDPSASVSIQQTPILKPPTSDRSRNRANFR
jgi:hypothetical protein